MGAVSKEQRRFQSSILLHSAETLIQLTFLFMGFFFFGPYFKNNPWGYLTSKARPSLMNLLGNQRRALTHLPNAGFWEWQCLKILLASHMGSLKGACRFKGTRRPVGDYTSTGTSRPMKICKSAGFTTTGAHRPKGGHSQQCSD